MMTFKQTAPMVAILALGSAMLFAGDALARGPGGAAFSEMDTNGDGKITLEEFQAFKTAQVAKIDTNGDGILSEEELVAAEKAREAQREQERQMRRYERLLSQADTNGDGKLSVEEFEAFMQARADGPRGQMRGPMTGPMGGPMGGPMTGPMGGPMGGQGRAPNAAPNGAPPAAAPAAQNGFPPGWDANGDGVVTEQEFQAALAYMMQQRRGPMPGPNPQGGRQGSW